MMPHLYHYISIYDKRTKKTMYEKRYNFPSEPKSAQPWSTYRSVPASFLDASRMPTLIHGDDVGSRKFVVGTSWKRSATRSGATSRTTGSPGKIAFSRWRRSMRSTKRAGWERGNLPPRSSKRDRQR